MSPRLARLLVVLAVTCAGASVPIAALDHAETIQRSFTLNAIDGRRLLVVDNVSGSIVIEAGAGDSVELTLAEHYEARSAQDLARARQEVELEIRENPGSLELVQGGSWRCRRERGADGRRRGDCCCADDDRRYTVRYDWTLRVPREIDLDVSTVNDGEIRITGTVGELDVHHVNDDVTLARVGGRVDASTVNGALKVDFASLPAADCRFGTVNGDIDLAFPKGFGAELSFATLNGEVYTDFSFALPKLPATREYNKSSGTKHRHEIGKTSRATIGAGGAGLECSSVNGNIYIRERS